MRCGLRLFTAGLLAGATCLATLSLAQQPKGKPPAAKPKPAARPDAQAATEETASGADAGATTEAPAPAEVGDGGLQSSPLTPQPNELPSPTFDAGAPVDYDRVLADIAALRARVAAVADNLYQSRIAIAVQNDASHARIARLTVALDDGTVYSAPSTFSAADMTTVYDHAVAPGRHAVTLDVERKDAREESVRTAQRSRFMVDVPRDHRLTVEVKMIDDSSMGGDFPKDKSGEYDLRFRVKATAKRVGK